MAYDRRRLQEYRRRIEELRRLVVRTPMWRVSVRGGRPVVVATHTNEVLLVVEGRWTPDLRRFFDQVHQYSLLRLLALLEKAEGLPCQPEAERFLESLRPPESSQVIAPGARGGPGSA